MSARSLTWKVLMMRTALVLIRGRIVFIVLCTVSLIALFLQGKYQTLVWTDPSPHPHQLSPVRREYPDASKAGQTILDSSRHQSSQRIDKSTFIAIGCAITSKGLDNLRHDNMMHMFPFLRTLLPSFCKTASSGYNYRFYLAFDHTDQFLGRRDSLHQFSDSFQKITKQYCPSGSNYTLHFVRCGHSGKPAWAQNDAMIEAYLDDCEYYYRVNDDSLLQTTNWTGLMISALRSQTPPNVGVVGPVHTGGNEDILTQDFVHKTHIDIFGFYYPRMFSEWWADDWMTLIYQPDRMVRLSSVNVIHTQERGTRYKPRLSTERSLMDQVKRDQQALIRYLDSKERRPDPAKVISMCLWGEDSRYTYGLLRNAQLVPVFFPEWVLRVYTEKKFLDGLNRYQQVPERILEKLESLGAEIKYVDTSKTQVAPMMWRFLVADDLAIKWFIVRDADGRLSDRDAVAVEKWMNSSAIFHCIRDHPSHAGYPLLGGLWGGRPEELKTLIPLPWEGMMRGVRAGYGDDMNFLAQGIYPKVQNSLMCHDSVSCQQWPNSYPFPVQRQGTEHVGQVFDAFGNARDEDIDILIGNGSPAACTTFNDSYTYIQQKSKDPLVLPGLSPQYVIWSVSGGDRNTGEAFQQLLYDSGVQFLMRSPPKNCDLETCSAKSNKTKASQIVHGFEMEPKDLKLLQIVTHFLCYEKIGMCEQYCVLNKTVIVVTTAQQESSTETSTKTKKKHEKCVESPLIVTVGSTYDKAYVEHSTGIKATLLPVFCTNWDITYPLHKKNGFLAHFPQTNSQFQEAFMKNLTLFLKNTTTSAVPVYVLYPHLQKSDIVSYKGIVYVPGDLSPANFCELYGMNIPLFFPSIKLLLTWQIEHQVLRNFIPQNIDRKYNKTKANVEQMMKWVKLAEFYQWPHIIYYTSVQDLSLKLIETELDTVTLGMQMQNNDMKTRIKSQWLTLLEDSAI